MRSLPLPESISLTRESNSFEVKSPLIRRSQAMVEGGSGQHTTKTQLKRRQDIPFCGERVAMITSA